MDGVLVAERGIWKVDLVGDCATLQAVVLV